MLSDREKKEMLADGLSRTRREEFLSARKKRAGSPVSLDDYIAFLLDVQKIKPFEHKPTVTPDSKNIL